MRTSYSQFQLLVEFMERNGDLSKPAEGPQGRVTNVHRWAQLTELLNADSTGDTKSIEKWRKVWSDLKNNTKKKAARIHRDATGTGGGPASRVKLTDLEERVMNLIGPQAATGIINIPEVGLSQEDVQPIPASVNSEVETEVIENVAENGFDILWSQVGISGSAPPTQLPEDETEPPPPSLPPPSPPPPMPSTSRGVEDRQPNIPEAPQLPTPLPLTPRRRRRLIPTASPTRRRNRTRTQTQSELARQAFVNSDNEWRLFQQRCEEERLRLRERELNQQERWLDLFGQLIILGNRFVDLYQNNNNNSN